MTESRWDKLAAEYDRRAQYALEARDANACRLYRDFAEAVRANAAAEAAELLDLEEAKEYSGLGERQLRRYTSSGSGRNRRWARRDLPAKPRHLPAVAERTLEIHAERVARVEEATAERAAADAAAEAKAERIEEYKRRMRKAS